MTKQHYHRTCTTVEVLSELLACEIRSNSDGGKDLRRLEAQVEAIPATFARLAKRTISTAAQRRAFARNWRRLLTDTDHSS